MNDGESMVAYTQETVFMETLLNNPLLSLKVFLPGSPLKQSNIYTPTGENNMRLFDIKPTMLEHTCFSTSPCGGQKKL